jgi:hypothetical protein
MGAAAFGHKDKGLSLRHFRCSLVEQIDQGQHL